LSAAAAPVLAAAPAWDTSGNGLLSGTYNFRQVLYISDGSGDISQMVAYFGTITFSGTGTYSLSNGNTLVNPAGGLTIPLAGAYSAASSGFGFLSNPLATGTSVYFLIWNGILIGSSTESGSPSNGSNGSFVNDLFIAAPVTTGFSSSNFKGAYTMAGFLPAASPTSAADVSFQLNPDGAGNLGTVNMSGYNGASGSTVLTQSNANVSYIFTSGTGTITFPTSSAATFYSGPESLYLSPDANFVFGGSPTGFDMFVGVRNASEAATLTTGLYYEAGLDEDESQLADNGAVLDTYYGVFNAFGGNIIGHQRLLWAGYSSAEDETYSTTYPPSVTGSYPGPTVGQLDPSGSVQYSVGANGIRVGFGIGPYLGIEAGFPTASPKPFGAVYLDPTGVVNSASSAPFTAGISPGEFLTFYNGVNLANSATCATTLPFPTMLGSVQVLIDNMPAPIYCVGSQTTVIVPYEVNASPIASIQVVNNGTSSNVVTVYVRPTSPGVLTVPPGGLGFAAAQHGDYSLITPAHPAQPGETIVVYLVGLGSVYPPYTDGAATPAIGSIIVNHVEVDVGGYGSTDIPYAGLTPGDAGLYQINFQVPANAPPGNDAIAIAGPGSYSSEALLPVGTGPAAAPAIQVPAKALRRRLPRLR
jgi:uncharacterized protein (TIGR03437 family)